MAVEFKAEVVQGIAKESKKAYVMIVVKTGVDSVDKSLKPIFLNDMQIEVLKVYGIDVKADK